MHLVNQVKLITEVDNIPSLLHKVTELSQSEVELLISHLIHLRTHHKFSQHTQLFQHQNTYYLIDLLHYDQDEIQVVALKLMSMCEPPYQQASVDERQIKITLPSFGDIVRQNFPHLSKQLKYPKHQLKTLHQLNSTRLYNLLKKVTGHRNQHLSAILSSSKAPDDLETYRQIQKTFESASQDIRLNNRMHVFFDMMQHHQDKFEKCVNWLDFGGENGQFISTLRAKVDRPVQATCTDIAQWMSKPHQNNDSLHIKYCYIHQNILPFADHSFDFVACLQVLHHVDDLQLTLSELYRVMQPQSLLFLREHDCKGEEDQVCIDIEHLLYEIVYRKNEAILPEYQALYLSKPFLHRMLQQHGFECLEHTTPTGITKCYYTLWYKK
jgi:ubiquinone/menaquinone biosynthesis C-methylase UbiE